MTADQQSQLGTQITNQPVPTFTAASYQSSGGGGSSGGDDGSGNSQAALADSSDTADASKGGATEAATEETGPDPAQASTGWC
jgi:hypothetical protein